MATLEQRLTMLESSLTKRTKVLLMPLLMGIIDNKITDEQQQRIDKAHAEGRMVIQLVGLKKDS